MFHSIRNDQTANCLPSTLSSWRHDRNAVLLMASGVACLLYLSRVALGWDHDAANDLLPTLAIIPVELLPVVLAGYAASAFPRTTPGRRAWFAIALAEASVVLGDVVRAYDLAIRHAASFPSLADAGDLLVYPLFLVGLLQFSRSFHRPGDRLKLWLDVGTVLVGASTIIWYLMIGPLIASSPSPGLATAVALAYPVGDLAILLGITWVSVSKADPHENCALPPLVLGLLLYVAGDLLYATQSLQSAYHVGQWSDLPRVLAAFLLAASAYSQSRTPTAVRTRDAELTPATRPLVNPLPYLALAIGFALTLLAVVDDWTTPERVIYVGGLVLTGLVIARLVVVLRDNGDLYYRLEKAYRDVVDGHLALRASEERYRRIVETAQEGIWVIDPDNRTTFANQKMAEMLGYTVNEMLGRCVFDFIDPEMRAAAIAQLEQRRSGIAAAHEFKYRRADGTALWAKLATNPIFDGDRYIGGLALVTDVTEQRLADEQLRETNRQLEAALRELRQSQRQVIQQERLRALGQMASGIAHDFNNALAPIVGYAELLLESPTALADTAKTRTYLEYMATAAADAAAVVRRLREFYRARDESDVLEPVDLNGLIAQAVALTQPRWKDEAQALGASIRVETDLADTAMVLGQEPELRELLTNLIFNAVDAMPSGGTLTLRTRVEAEAVRLDLQDTGVGMTEEVRRRCFEPLFTSKGTRGTGLGLAVVQGIVRRHSGTIDVESTPGRGTTFSVRLPVGNRCRLATRLPTPPAIGPLAILYVDDEVHVRHVVAAQLAADGHQVTTAADGREGLRHFVGGHFDLVITDRAMPEMNGDQVAEAIKQQAPNTPIILLTGFGDILQATGTCPKGVDLVISKPAQLPQLRAAIARVLGGDL